MADGCAERRIDAPEGMTAANSSEIQNLGVKMIEFRGDQVADDDTVKPEGGQ